MKRTLLLVVTAFATLFASCQKEDLGRILTATIEQYQSDSKAYINDSNYACWENGDEVSINGTTHTISINDDAQTATITNTQGLSGDLLAFYPASMVSNLSATGGTVSLPHLQTYETTTVNGVTYQKIQNPMAAYCPAEGSELKFRNLGALLKVTIQGNTYVKGIQVKGIDNQMLCGTAPLKLNSQRRPVLGEFAKGSNSVLLNFAAPTEVSGSKSFYIVVPGGTLFTNITIAVLTTDATGTTYTSYCKTGFLGESLSRNNIGAINYTFLGDQDDTFTPDWMIRYTASAQVTPYNTSAFGDANYLSANSSFSNNSGYLLFDRPLTTIGNNAFQSCTALTSISLPAGVTSIGFKAFNWCNSLTSISLPDNLTSIGERAFYCCSSLTSITLPAGVTSIGSSAFLGCRSLTSIDLPASLESIGEDAFSSCSSLTSISLPENLTEIGGFTFYSCSSLTSITLPESLTSIGANAFEDCSSLTRVDCYATTPPDLGLNAFKNIPSPAEVHVRSNCVDDYRDSRWEDVFTANRIIGDL